VREFLADDVLPGTSGRLSFHARVAANVVGIVERELARGAEQAERRRRALAPLGVASEAELASAIRAGELDDRSDEVVRVVVDGVADKLAVANPRYLAAVRDRA
jgi:hydroxymethylglutaryl-CoA reductase